MADSLAAPTMLGFIWTEKYIDPAMRNIPGDLWCVRDSYSALMGWPIGSENWGRFVESPTPEDMERLDEHLGLVVIDPIFAEHRKELLALLDHPGVAGYDFHGKKTGHAQYQPHLRHFQRLPEEYNLFDPNSELMRIVVNPHRPADTRECRDCIIQSIVGDIQTN